MKAQANITWYSYRPLWALLLLLVLVRIPTFDRPLSKHDDFNNAVILINAVSWQQAGGGSKFCFTPVMNFQGASNKVLEKGNHIDINGNHVYLSFGAGWYVLPYFFFSMLPVDPSEAGLEVLNILFGLLSTVLLFRWLTNITRQHQSAFYATLLFVLLPTPLWYMGHSYVTTGIMMPLLIWLLQVWHNMAITTSRISWHQYLAFFIASLLLTYFDWIGVFLPIGMVAWYIFQRKWQRETFLFTAIAAVAVLGSVFLILFQFACHLGWEQVWGYWQSRFTERSVSAGQSSFGHSFSIFIRFFIPSYGPLIAAVFVAMFSAARKKASNHWISYAIGATIVYNLVFLNWSLEHEFAWMVMAVLVLVWLAQYRSDWLASGAGKKWGMALSACSLAIYFFINPPGTNSRSGQRYNAQKNLGLQIANSIPDDVVIFTNLSNAKIEEWYARRTFNQANDWQGAQRMTDSLHLKKAIWMEVQQNRIIDLKSIK